MSALIAAIVRSRLASAALLVIMCAAVYANAVGNAFQYDDRHAIVENDHLRSLENIPEFFTHPEYFSRDEEKAMYRPLLLATLTLNHYWSGYETASYHLINILLHALMSIAVWLLFIELRLSVCLALLGGVLFAVHPLATEPVNYISSRSEVMVGLFVVASLWLYLRSGPRQWLPRGRSLLVRIGSLVCFAAALGSKEIGVVLPVLILLTDHYDGRRWRAQVAAYVPYAVVVAAYLLYIRSFVNTALVSEPVRSMSEQFGTQLKALPYYLKLVVMPTGLTVHHAFSESSLADGTVVLSALSIIALIVIVGWPRKGWPGQGWRAQGSARESRADGLVRFGLAWIGVVLLPTFVVPLNVLVNEHRLYLVLVGALLSVLGINRFESIRGLLWGGPVLGLVFSVLVLQQNAVWSDEGSLWSNAKRRAPLAIEPHVYLGNYARSLGEHRQAIQHFNDALALDSGNVVASNNLANAYRDLEQWRAALDIYARVLAADPTLADVHYNIARTFQYAGDLASARSHYLLVDSTSHHVDLALNNLGTLIEGERPDSAAVYYRSALRHRPGNSEARSNLDRLRRRLPSMADALKAQGQHGVVVGVCRQLLMEDPRDESALWVITTTLWETGAYTQSIAANRELVRAHPNHWYGSLQLANALESTNQPEGAAEVYVDLISRCKNAEIRAAAINRYQLLQARAGGRA